VETCFNSTGSFLPGKLFDFLIMMTDTCVSNGGILEPFPMKYLVGQAKANYRRGSYTFQPKIPLQLVEDTHALHNDAALYIRCHSCINDSEIVEFLGEKRYRCLVHLQTKGKHRVHL